MQKEKFQLNMTNNNDFIRNYVDNAPTDEEKKLRRKECATQFNLSLPQVAAITAWTTIRNKTTLTTEPIQIEYDNTVKNLWRQKWKEFVDKHTFISERPNLKILCLPGKKCLEIPLYLELGFKPENITGVEGDKEIQKEFSANAQKYGIIAKVGKLDNIITETEVYDIISLDFTGPISRSNLDIVRNLPIAPRIDSNVNTKSLFMINVLGKRETQTNQQTIDFYASFIRPELQEMFQNRMDSMQNFNKVAQYMKDLADRTLSGEKVYEEADLKDKRNAALTFAITSLISTQKRMTECKWRNYKLSNNENTENFQYYASKVLGLFIEKINLHLEKRWQNFFAIGLTQVIDIVFKSKAFIYEMEQYQYISPINDSPFLTEMYQLLTPMADYIRASAFMKFFLDAIVWQMTNENKEINIAARYKNGRELYQEKLQNKDYLVFLDPNGFVISTISWNKVVETYVAMIDHVERDKVTRIMTDGKISRVNLQ